MITPTDLYVVYFWDIFSDWVQHSNPSQEKIKSFAIIYLVDVKEVPDFNTMYESLGHPWGGGEPWCESRLKAIRHTCL